MLNDSDLNLEASNSAILSLVRDLNMRLMDNDQQQVYEILERKLTTQGHTLPHDYGTSIVFESDVTLERNYRSIFQVKPGNPTDPKVKYLAPSGQSPDIFLPCIPGMLRLDIAKNLVDEKYFWDAVAKDSNIPICITEGGKKTLSLVSAGICAIGVAGIEVYTVLTEEGERVLHPQLIQFLQAGREITIVFDEDSKPSTRAKVRAAKIKLISRIQGYCNEVIIKVAEWNPVLGKGIDDVLANNSRDTLTEILAKAKHVKVESGELAPGGKFKLFTMTPDKPPKMRPDNQIVAKILEESREIGGGIAFTKFFYSRSHLSFMVYRLGVWVQVTENYMEGYVDKMLDAGLRGSGLGWDSAKIKAIVALLKIRSGNEMKLSDRGLVPFSNGVLNLATMTMEAHSPEYSFTSQRPYAYDVDAPEPTAIIDFLRETQGGCEVKVKALRAWFRAVVTNRTDLQKFLQIVGPGGTGKTVFMNLCLALVGSANTITMSLEQMGGRFSTQWIQDKSLIISPDVDPFTKSLAALKQITGGDPLVGEKKGEQQTTQFLSRAMVLITGNAPIVCGSDDGMLRRIITIYFNNKIKEGSRRHLIGFNEGALTGEFAPLIPSLMKWALEMPESEMLKMLSESNSVAELVSGNIEALIESDSLAAFIVERVGFAETASSRVGSASSKTEGGSKTFIDDDTRLYPAYLRFCQDSGISKPLALKSFTKNFVIVCNNALKQSISKDRDRYGAIVKGCYLLAPPTSIAETPQVTTPIVDEPFIIPTPIALDPIELAIESLESEVYEFDYEDDESMPLLS